MQYIVYIMQYTCIYIYICSSVYVYIDILYIPIYQFKTPVALCFWGFTVPKSSQIDPF